MQPCIGPIIPTLLIEEAVGNWNRQAKALEGDF
jgi:hypothetical protein